jgi:hypothetical protein
MKAKCRYNNQTMMLVNATTGMPVHVGDVARTFRGEVVTVLGGSPPHKPESTGRVQVEIDGHDMEYYPGVIDAKWIEV